MSTGVFDKRDGHIHLSKKGDPKILISGEHEAVPWLRVIQSRPAPAATFVSCSGFGQKNVVRNGSSRQEKTEI